MKKTKIIHAINTHNFSRLMKLIKNEEDANIASNIAGKTPTILASKYNNTYLLRHLLKFKINLDATTYTKINNILKDFQNEFNFINSYEETALWWACRYNNYESVKILCDAKANVNLSEKGSSPLMEASKNGHLNIIKLLVQNGANINYCSFDKHSFDYVYPLKEAVRYKYKNIILYLLEHNSIVHDERCVKTIFEISATRRYNNIFKMLIEKVKQNKNYYLYKHIISRCLIISARSDHTTIAEYILENDIDIDIVDVEGDTALIEASRRHNTKLVKLLLTNKCDCTITNKKGLAALDIAKQGDIIKLIKDYNTDMS